MEPRRAFTAKPARFARGSALTMLAPASSALERATGALAACGASPRKRADAGDTAVVGGYSTSSITVSTTPRRPELAGSARGKVEVFIDTASISDAAAGARR